jgi:hypothetical protein
MKITKEQLKKLIKEELRMLQEGRWRKVTRMFKRGEADCDDVREAWELLSPDMQGILRTLCDAQPAEPADPKSRRIAWCECIDAKRPIDES